MEPATYIKTLKPILNWPGFSVRSLASVEKNLHIFMQRPLLNSFEILIQPLLYFLAFGFGLEFWIPEIGGLAYNEFVFFGVIAATAMTSALYESSYSIYERYLVGRSYIVLKTCPLSINEILLGEWIWSIFKSSLVCSVLLLIGKSMDVVRVVDFLPILLCCIWLAIIFSSVGMFICAISNSFSRSFQYSGLVAVPIFLFSGVFFPVEKLSLGLAAIIELLPLGLGVGWVRSGDFLSNFGFSAGLSFIYLCLSILIFNWSSTKIASRLNLMAEEKSI